GEALGALARALSASPLVAAVASPATTVAGTTSAGESDPAVRIVPRARSNVRKPPGSNTRGAFNMHLLTAAITTADGRGSTTGTWTWTWTWTWTTTS
ncbi:MAG: hypothetical protein QME96_15905, partial [Myxococcota bacterium]|nr:hypothetical protein [Myxococcota bacterium]